MRWNVSETFMYECYTMDRPVYPESWVQGFESQSKDIRQKFKMFSTYYVEIYLTFTNAQLHRAQLEYFKSNKCHTEISKKSKMYPWEISYISWFDKYKQFESTFHSDFSWWKMKTMTKVCQWCQLMLMLMLLKVEEARRKLRDVPSYSLSSLDRCKSSSNAR